MGVAAYILLVPLVIAIELVVGIVHNLSLILFRAYPEDIFYVAFVALHLVTIVTGIVVYPRDGVMPS